MSDDKLPETIFGFPVVRDPSLKAAEMRLGAGLFPPIKFRMTLRAAPGRVVNLEVDVLAKYVEKLVVRA